VWLEPQGVARGVQHQVTQHALPRGPWTEARFDIDMPERAGVDERRAPRIGQFASAGESHIRIVGARHHHAAKWQGRARNRRKSANTLGRVAW